MCVCVCLCVEGVLYAAACRVSDQSHKAQVHACTANGPVAQRGGELCSHLHSNVCEL